MPREMLAMRSIRAKVAAYLLPGVSVVIAMYLVCTRVPVPVCRYVRIKDSEEWPPRFTKLELVLEDGTRVALTDGRSCATASMGPCAQGLRHCMHV